MKNILPFICFSFFSFSGFTQSLPDSGKSQSPGIHHFTRGLIVNSASRYGREALYTDEAGF